MQGETRIGKHKGFILWQSFFFVLALLLAFYILFRSPLFIIDRVVVQGHGLLKESEIVRASGIVTGLNIFQADLQSATSKIQSMPVIKEVQVERILPGTIAVKVVERVPVALVVHDGRFLELDEQGHYLRQGQAGTAGLPVLTGIVVQKASPGRPVAATHLDLALQVVQELPPTLRAKLSEVHLGQDRRVVLYTMDGVECQLGLPDEIYQKGDYFLQVQRELGEKGKVIEYVDFSVLNSPVVKYKG